MTSFISKYTGTLRRGLFRSPLSAAFAIAMLVAGMTVMATGFAQAASYKVVDKSAKSIPDWVHTQPAGAILVELERPTLGEAQSAAETEIARRIISAVATNIDHSTSYNASERISNNVNDLDENFTINTETYAARIPFLKGISLSQALGTYWEKRQEKASGKQYVSFSVLYPLSERELKEMTDAYEKQDREADEELRTLSAGVSTVDSSEALLNAETRLQYLSEYFIDKRRRDEAAAALAAYKECAKALSLEGEVDGAAGKIYCRVMLHGRPFRLVAQPAVKSDCASRLATSWSQDGCTLTISYSAEDCLPTENNSIELTLKSKLGRLRQTFFIP